MEWVLPAAGLFCVLGAATCAVSAYALHMALKAVIDVKALQNSTHNIQFVPAEPPSDDKALNAALERNDREAMERLQDVSQFDQQPLM